MVWGIEDNGMKFRAARSGLKLVCWHDNMSMLHQWLPTAQSEILRQEFMNDVRFQLGTYGVVKQPTTWGGHP
jgi:hypothetical protein